MIGSNIASLTEYLAITSLGIHDIKHFKKAFIWPLQKWIRFDVTPINYAFQVHAMSSEKLPFILPAVFTIGPKDEEESLILYARLMSAHHKNSNHVKDVVKSIIEGETRVLAASMTMEEIFKGMKQFKKEVFQKVQLDLNEFGLLIYNAKVKQLVNDHGHEYFSQMEAANQAKVLSFLLVQPPVYVYFFRIITE